MPGPTAWLNQLQAINSSNQNVTSNVETVVCSLGPINSRGPGAPVYLVGAAAFQVAAATTQTALRIRIGGLTGALVGQAGLIAGTAGTSSQADAAVAGTDTPAGEYAGQTYVLTLQSTNAGGSWNCAIAQLSALF